MTKEMVEKQAVLALEKDVCVLTGDIGVFRFKSIDPQAVEEIPAVQMEMPKYKEESPEEVAFAIAPFDVWTTTGWINVLHELYQYGYVIFKYRKRIQLNTLLTQKELDDACMKYKLNTIQSCLALSMIVLWDVFGFGGRRRLIRFMSEYKTYIDAFSEGSLTWEDILETLDTKCGIKLDLSDDLAERR